MKKGLGRSFLNYGIRQEDMALIEQACRNAEIWRKRSIPTHSERFNPPTFESEIDLKTAKKRSIAVLSGKQELLLCRDQEMSPKVNLLTRLHV